MHIIRLRLSLLYDKATFKNKIRISLSIFLKIIYKKLDLLFWFL